jgi:hypothetical protein
MVKVVGSDSVLRGELVAEGAGRRAGRGAAASEVFLLCAFPAEQPEKVAGTIPGPPGPVRLAEVPAEGEVRSTQ